MKNKTNINDLYFGVMISPMSWDGRENRSKLQQINLFDSLRVKRSVAAYVAMTPEQRRERVNDPLSFCFGDVWGRTEWEFIVCPWPFIEGTDTISNCGVKVSTYDMYVKPNADLLMDMISRVTVSSAKKVLAEWRKKR